MKISTIIKNKFNKNEVIVTTNEQSKKIQIPSKESGYGSFLNGGELLLLSMAVCYCNDIYREAAKRNIKIVDVEVEVTGSFGGEGDPGTNFEYKPRIKSNASKEELHQLIIDTDRIAEIHKTLRQGIDIRLKYE
ncbi:MAG: OsmC family protein [Cyclobacteriaceae bacterium]